MGEGSGQIRQEIEETRGRVGEEVEALSYKTDVGARLDDYVGEKKDAVTSKVASVKDAATSAVGHVVPSKQTMRQAGSTARRNPLGLAIGAAAFGFVAGLLIPSTRMEDERLGDVGDRVRETASEAGQQALERGKEVARSAAETVRDEGAEQSRELASDLADRVQTDDDRQTERMSL
jgi:gas vesicle protein